MTVDWSATALSPTLTRTFRLFISYKLRSFSFFCSLPCLSWRHTANHKKVLKNSCSVFRLDAFAIIFENAPNTGAYNFILSVSSQFFVGLIFHLCPHRVQKHSAHCSLTVTVAVASHLSVAECTQTLEVTEATLNKNAQSLLLCRRWLDEVAHDYYYCCCRCSFSVRI